MEAGNSNNSKHKTRISFSENSSSRDGTVNNGNQWHESHREQRRDHGKNRERGHWNRDKSVNGKKENSRDEESQERFRDQVQVTSTTSTSYPVYNYPTNDRPYVESGHPLSVMSYNMMAAAAMNPGQWRVNSMDNVPMAQASMPSTSTMPTAMEMVQSSSNMPFNAYMGMPGDYGVLNMNNYGLVGQFGMVTGQENMMIPQVKEVIHFSKGVLLPPNPNSPSPATRQKPPGCKTVFVGGLPEKITEEIIREIFEKSGEIDSIRMSKKKFCHIRFKEASSVERALYYSGYRMKIDNNDEPAFTGRLHVDYAVARDDQFEYECQQRLLQRVARHNEREFFRSTTPPVTHYTEHEATLIAEKLRNEETFLQAACVLINWLDRGECSKRNAGTFYSMIQSTNSHVRRLITEKGKYEEQLNDAKEKLKKQMEGITHQFYEIEKVFKSASLQKVWDHFTKAQRKNIELWKKQTDEIKRSHLEEVINEREDEEMELSDDENGDSLTDKSYEDEIAKLKEEKGTLESQLGVAQEEIILIQKEADEQLNSQEEKITSLCIALQNSNKRKEESQGQDFRVLKSRRILKQDDENQADHNEFDEKNLGPGTSVSSSSLEVSITENEARLIGLVSTFLHIHPFGANIDYICSFLQQINSTIQARDVENLMKRYQTVFREVSTGIGASLGKKWCFLGFEKH